MAAEAAPELRLAAHFSASITSTYRQGVFG
jgi:hypothetical protein